MDALARFAVGAAAAGHRRRFLPLLVARWASRRVLRRRRTQEGRGGRRSGADAVRDAGRGRRRLEPARRDPVRRWSGPIFRVSAGGGEPKPATTLDKSRGETQHRWPSFLPDGRHFLYLARGPQQASECGLRRSLDGTEAQQLVSADSPAVYAPPGLLLYVREGTLWRSRSTRRSGASPATPRPWPSRSRRSSERPAAAPFPSPPAVCSPTERAPTSRKASSSGSTARVARSGRWVSLRITRTPRSRPTARVSPSAGATRRLMTRDIWLFELERGTASRLTFDPADDLGPVFSPDGTRILFTSDRKGMRDIYWKASTGVGEDEPVLEGERKKNVNDCSPDGRFVVYDTGGDAARARQRRHGGSLGGAARRGPQVAAVPGAAVYRQPSPDLTRRPMDRLQLRRVRHSGGLRAGLPEPEGEVEGLDRGRGGGPVAAGRAGAVLHRRTQAHGGGRAARRRDVPGRRPPGPVRNEPRPGILGRNRYVVSPDGQRFLFSDSRRAGRPRAATVVLNWR